MNFANTNWNLYKPFVTVYETRNLHKASEILGVSRAAVSKNLKELGNQLGVRLFNATSKGVVPTGEAVNLYDLVRGAVTSFADAETGFAEFTPQSPAQLKVGISSAIVELLVGDYLREFCVKYPKCKLEFYKQENFNALRNGELDFILTINQYSVNPEFTVKDLHRVNLNFVATRGLLKKHGVLESVTMDEFLRLPIAGYRETWIEFLKLNKINPAPENVIITQSSELNYRLARNGLGLGMYCSELFDPVRDPEIVQVNIKNAVMPTATIIYIYNKTISRPARAFLDGLKSFVTSPSR